MRVQSLHVYPVKATGPVTLPHSSVELQGLRHDRRWAVLGEAGRRLNAARHDRLLSVTATPDDDGSLLLQCTGMRSIRVKVPVGGTSVPTNISRLPTAIDAGDEAAGWFSAVLDRTARLVWQDDPSKRPISPSHGGTGGEPLSLADTGPLLLTTTSSLARLNEWIAEGPDPAPVEMARFRPNVVIDGDSEPFAEDDWRRLRIGNLPYRFAEHCDRCVVTVIELPTLRHGKEPIRTLARHRKWGGKTWFGIRIAPLATGRIAVGDELILG